MTREKQIIEVETEHQLETVFGIEPGTTPVEVQQSSTELVPVETYDNKDGEIETQFQEVYNAAMDAYESSTGNEMQDIDPKYRARNAEVAVQYLNTALNAAKHKADMKMHKDKLGLATRTAKDRGKTVNNNLIVDRNDLLRNILSRNEEKSAVNDETSE